MTLKNFLNLTLLGFTLVLISCSGDSKSGGTSTGNGIVSVSFTTYNPSVKPAFEALAVNSLTMCFKRLRFKMAGETTDADPALDNDNIDLSLGQVTISSSGTNITSVSVPSGTYSRVEFDLEKDCDDVNTLNSVDLDNDNGTWATQDRITIKFEGTFTVGGGSQNLDLAIQSIITALSSVNADSEIRTQAESVSGSF